MSSEVDLIPSASSSRSENAVRRRGGPKARPLSSTVSTRSSESAIPHVLPDAIVDHGEDHSSSEDTAPQSSPPVTTSAAITGFISSESGTSDANTPSHSSLTEFAPLEEEMGSISNTARERRGPRSRRLPRLAHQRPNSLALSESESSFVTQDAGHYPSQDSGHFRARRRVAQMSPSISSSTPSDVVNDPLSEYQPGSDLSWSPEYPEYAIASQPPPQFTPSFDPRFAGPHQYPQYPIPPYSEYGVPETPRGTAPYPYFQAPPQPPPVAPQPSTPMAAAPPVGPHPGNWVLNGYALLAAKIAGDIVGPPVKPIYRRFDTASHRVLLSLQDQIVDLKERIDDMDATDAQRRHGAPAAERVERGSGEEFHRRKGETMGMLTRKLQQYYTLLTSLNNMLEMSQPTEDEIRAYRRFLDAERPVVEAEAEFLNAHDLVVMENRRTINPGEEPPQQENQGNRRNAPAGQRGLLPRGQLQELAVGMIVATFGPLVTFPVVRDFAGRLTIVLLASVAVYVVLLRSGLNPLASAQQVQEVLVWGATYIGSMAILAWLL
ncbi:hypothetical protein B0T10DRAFT_309439 [Thelonectria olida]|uniref:DUF6594 domain-containing protein n=1 Tax=Thelonectria olida TaxID=1576542 RepID=A0A9P8WA25_9HYPO|nr:hypothetical protein B0T10DRAFT_309439 [Thelonectria olida]